MRQMCVWGGRNLCLELKKVAQNIALNTTIGVLFSVSSQSINVSSAMIYANAIGGSAYFTSKFLRKMLKWNPSLLLRIAVVAPFSTIMGIGIGSIFIDGIAEFPFRWENLWNLVPIVGVTILGWIFIANWIGSLKSSAALERNLRIMAELRQSEASAKLALLQAQMEPHFLFNTLANILSLIESEPSKATAMLEALNKYLRVSLSRTRRTSYDLGEEIELVDALLNIFSMRHSGRLSYSIKISSELNSLPIPPFLLQPLVENALIHGLEQSPTAGTVSVEVEKIAHTLQLRVSDNGAGLQPGKIVRSGVGLSNIRARLEQIYGATARLDVESNEAGGVTSTIQLPLK